MKGWAKFFIFYVVLFMFVTSGYSDDNIARSFGMPSGGTLNKNIFNTSYDDGFWYKKKDEETGEVLWKKRMYGHTGVDINGGGNIVSTAVGEVVFSGWSRSGFGYMVRIRHTLESGDFIYSQYGHMKSYPVVKDGEIVSKGQKLGVMGSTGFSTGIHLHFEIKLLDDDGPGYSYGDVNVIKNYFDPIKFIENFNKIGRLNDDNGGFYLPVFKKYFDNAPKAGYPFNDNNGGKYFHEWKSVTDSSHSVFLQNFQGDMKAEHFGTDGQSAIILNDLDTPVSANLVKEGMWGKYRYDDGPLNYGVAYTEEIPAHYANSPFAVEGDFVSPNKPVVGSYPDSTNLQYITVQKFKRRKTVNNEVVADGRRTLVYNPEVEDDPQTDDIENVEHFAVGGFSIGAECDPADEDCIQAENKHQWYVAGNEYLTKAMPWPMLGITSPTGEWFMKACLPTQRYYFFRYENGEATDLRVVYISEGNSQLLDDPNEEIADSGIGSDTPFVISKVTLAKTVQTESPWAVSDETSDFRISDGRVYSWLELLDVSTQLEIKWEWYKNGSKIREQSAMTEDLSSEGTDCMYEWYRDYDYIDITSGDEGYYTLKVYVANELKVTKNFLVNSDSSSTAVVGPVDNLRVDNLDANNVIISWDAGYNNDYYKVYRNGTHINTPTVTTIEDGGANEGMTYTYVVESRVNGSDATATAQITVSVPLVGTFQADYEPSTYVGIAPLTVEFTNTSLGVPTDVLWDFKDGNWSTEKNPTHTFTSAGTYAVWLNVYRYQQVQKTITKTITVLEPSSFNLGIPTNVVASDDSGSEIVVNWSATESALMYDVYRDGKKIASVDSLSFTDQSVELDKTYSYQIVAVNGLYESEKSIADTGVAPDYLNSPSAFSYHISIPDMNNNGSVEIGALQIDATSGKPQLVVMDTGTLAEVSRVQYLHANCEVRGVSIYGDLDGAGGPEVGLLVFDYNDFTTKLEIRDALTGELFFGSGSSLPSPVNINLQNVTKDEVSLTWAEIEGAYSYNIYRDGNLLGNSQNTSYVDASVNPDTMYHYTIEAIRGALVSNQSIEFTVVTLSIAQNPPNQYSGHTYFTDTSSKVAFAGYAPQIKQPVLYVLETTTGEMVAEIPYLSPGYTPIGISKYVVDGQTLIGVLAQKQIGGETEIEIREIPSGILYSGSGEGTVLDPPTGIEGSNVTLSEATITWTAITGADSYRVYRDGVLLDEVGVNTLTDTGLDYATTYRYTVQAIVNNVISDISSEYLITTVSPVECLPSTYVAHEYFTDTSVKIAALGICPYNNKPYVYVVDIATGKIIADFAYHGAGFNPKGMSKFTIDGQVYMGVLAQNISEGGDEFEIRSMLDGSLYVGTALPEPTGFTMGIVTDQEVTFAWTAVPDATSYNIYRNGTQIGTSATNSYTDLTVEADSFYRYSVTAVSATQVSGLSAEIIIATPSGICVPSTYVDHKYISDGGVLKVVALGLCTEDNMPTVYIVNADTMVLESTISFHDADYTPIEIAIHEINGSIILEVLAKDESSGDNEIEKRYMSDGSLVQ